MLTCDHGGALIIPLGLLNRLMGRPNTGALFGADRAAIETAAMNAVMRAKSSEVSFPAM